MPRWCLDRGGHDRAVAAWEMRLEGLTYDAIGRAFGVSRTRASQLAAKGRWVRAMRAAPHPLPDDFPTADLPVKAGAYGARDRFPAVGDLRRAGPDLVGEVLRARLFGDCLPFLLDVIRTGP
jgi:hypothetical protein